VKQPERATTSLQIAGMGVQAPLGLEPRALAAAVRAGLCRFQARGWLPRKSDGSPIVTSFLPQFDASAPARERMFRMGVAAATQALSPLLGAGASPPEVPIPMLLSVPPYRPGMEQGEGAQLAREIMTALPVPPDQKQSGIFDTGQEGGLAALACAAGLIAQGRAEVCLVGGVESIREIELLHWLEEQGRLKGETCPSGFVPGESAAFLLVCDRAWLLRAGVPSLGVVSQPTRAMEPNPWYTGRPCLGEGLTQAIREAFASESLRAGVTWCDLNGEHWRADEWSFAYLRTVERHGEPLRIRHPADALGELGAAAGPMLVLLAALDLTHPRSALESALVFAASDTRPHRAACLVHRP
jgi:3-oxoacyl-[acyl-carrier-protein] synthase-1